MTQLQARTVDLIDAYWAAEFGCHPATLSSAGTLIVPHAGMAGYHGIFCLRRGPALVISVPADILAGCRVSLQGLSSADLDDLAALLEHIPASIDRVIGPAWTAYADRGSFCPSAAPAARRLSAADQGLHKAFRQNCPAEDWAVGGSDWGHLLVGAFAGERLTALAGFELWGDSIGHIAVVALPAFRGQGYGRQAVSLLGQLLLDDGLVPQYRTLVANHASVAIGKALGFVLYAETVAVRLAPQGTTG